MRRAAAHAAGLLGLLVVNYGIYRRERLLTEGRVVLLELSPVDPRSLMQGDYMRLNFAAADQVHARGGTRTADGRVVVALGPGRVGRFRRLDGGGPLRPDELALRYRVRSGQVNFAANAFFFQEGRAAAFRNARFGEFRVDGDGEMILTGLRGPGLEPLGARESGTRIGRPADAGA